MDVIGEPVEPGPRLGAGFRACFPALAERPGLAYLDSATTTPVPEPVLAALVAHLRRAAGSAGRGGHPGAGSAGAALRAARARVARFVGGDSAGVVLTGGGSEALAAVAREWGWAALRDGDQVLVSRLDHAATVRPWLDLRDRLAASGRHLDVLPYPIGPDGLPDAAGLAALVGPRTRLVCVSHVHHLFGSRVDVPRLREAVARAVPSARPLWLVDAGQSAGHVRLDVAGLGADFLTFSGHKMFAPPGVGVLYLGERARADLSDDALDRLEPGTANVSGAVALAAAVDLLETVGVDRIAAHSHELVGVLADGLRATPGVRILPGPARRPAPPDAAAEATARAEPPALAGGLVSFTVDGVPGADLETALADAGVHVRASGHCLLRDNPYGDAVRASVHAFSEESEVRRLLDALTAVTVGPATVGLAAVGPGGPR